MIRETAPDLDMMGRCTIYPSQDEGCIMLTANDQQTIRIFISSMTRASCMRRVGTGRRRPALPNFSIRFSPALATGAMALSSTFALSNALRLKRFRPTYRGEMA